MNWRLRAFVPAREPDRRPMIFWAYNNPAFVMDFLNGRPPARLG